MPANDLSPEDRVKRGKRLLLYGMFALTIVTVLAVFVTLWVITAPLGSEFTGIPITVTLIVGAIAIVACVIIWFVYTKLILKE
jgi:uncharacterized membrane protein YdbT with pleckstrin-like domain